MKSCYLLKRNIGKKTRFQVILIVVFFSFHSTLSAGPREQAKKIHDRIVGVPPSAAILESMAAKITQGDALSAAYEAMDNKLFYSVTLKNFATPWTNEAQSVFDELNDYSATVIGVVRDDLPFTHILTEDLVYIGSADQVSVAYSHTENTHYQELENKQVDLSDPLNFFGVPQSSMLDSQVLPGDTAGVLTLRAFAKAFLSGGTNRLAWRFIGINHLCSDMESLIDITLTPDRIRQDVSRSPGGDSSIFLNSCVGCHNGMDPMSQAFAYFNYDEELGQLVHTPGQVQDKYLINSNTFPQGFVTQDNRWNNYWRNGKNAALGWRGEISGGFGVKTLGQEVAASRKFSQCHVEQVFEKICIRKPVSILDRQEVERVASVFETNNYSLKRVFAEVASYCMSE